jgi:hypothetical protein
MLLLQAVTLDCECYIVQCFYHGMVSSYPVGHCLILTPSLPHVYACSVGAFCANKV